MIRKFFISAAIAAVAMTSQVQAEPLKEVNFGIISTESTQNLKPLWEPFLADMEKALGLKVNAFFAPDYAGIIEGMRFNKVDVAWYGNKAAMEAVDRAGAEIFAQTVDSDGNPGYWSLLVTHKDSPLNSLEDVIKCDKTLNFGYGDPNSTSGYLVPGYYVFAQNGKDPKDCFKTVRNANHETNLMAAANKQVDVATNNTENLRALETRNPEAAKQIKVIWKSPLIPSDPIAWRSNLDAADKAKIMTFFMTYGRIGDDKKTEKERGVLEALKWAPFVASSNDQLIPIRQLSLYKDRIKALTDETLSEADKKAKVAAVDEKLEALKARATQLKM